eukprot:SAG31_NODE_2641_length_5326_cov_9.734647_4_plen_82_part_00
MPLHCPGIPESVIEEAFAVSSDFFALAQSVKLASSPFEKTLNSGYEYMSQVRPSTGTADQKESLQVMSMLAHISTTLALDA